MGCLSRWRLQLLVVRADTMLEDRIPGEQGVAEFAAVAVCFAGLVIVRRRVARPTDGGRAGRFLCPGGGRRRGGAGGLCGRGPSGCECREAGANGVDVSITGCHYDGGDAAVVGRSIIRP